MAEDVRSECHNSSISPIRGGKEGELKCDVCGNKVSGTGARVAPTAPAAAEEEGKTKAPTVAESIAKDAMVDESEKTGAEGTAAEGAESTGAESGAAAEGSQEGAGAAEGSGAAAEGGTE